MAPIQSVSYYDKESSLTPAYMRRVDIEFQKLGLRGVTIVVCSGDEGTAEDEKAHTTDASFPSSQSERRSSEGEPAGGWFWYVEVGGRAGD